MHEASARRVCVRPACDDESWRQAASLLFAYQQETAVEVGAPCPARPEEVWLPVRRETLDPASVLDIYLVAYVSAQPVGGVALVAHDAASTMLKRCYVLPSWRRQGIARELVDHAARVASARGAGRLVLDVLPSRSPAIRAWKSMGFVEADPWGKPEMVYFELRIPRSRAGGQSSCP